MTKYVYWDHLTRPKTAENGGCRDIVETRCHGNRLYPYCSAVSQRNYSLPSLARYAKGQRYQDTSGVYKYNLFHICNHPRLFFAAEWSIYRLAIWPWPWTGQWGWSPFFNSDCKPEGIFNLTVKVLHPWIIRVATALDFMKYSSTYFKTQGSFFQRSVLLRGSCKHPVAMATPKI